MQRRSDHVTFPLFTILAALALLGALIMLLTSLTRLIINAKPVGTPMVYNELYEERVEPFHMVNTGKVEVTVSEKTPQEVYDGLCSTCHRDGLNDAPLLGDTEAWQARLNERGWDGLQNSSLNGFNNNLMPAKGGDPRLSDSEVVGALKYMLSEAGIDVDALGGETEVVEAETESEE